LPVEKYLKKLDITGNFISEASLLNVVQKGLKANTSLLCLDTRINPGYTH
jgi:hypothetical protein